MLKRTIGSLCILRGWTGLGICLYRNGRSRSAFGASIRWMGKPMWKEWRERNGKGQPVRMDGSGAGSRVIEVGAGCTNNGSRDHQHRW